MPKEKPARSALLELLDDCSADDLVSIIAESDVMEVLLEAASGHEETVKQASAIRKVEFKTSRHTKWHPRENLPGGGWKRKSEKNTYGEVNVVVTYLDGKTQSHKVPKDKEVEYRDGQYFFPDAGTESA